MGALKSLMGADLHHIDSGPALDLTFELPHACAVTHALACSFLCVALCFTLPTCNTCNRSGCDSLGTPAADDHKSAIAGVIASESDTVGNGCQECPFASMTLSIWTVPTQVTDAASAKAIIQAAPASVTLQADGRYRQALDPGSYLLCAAPSSYESACLSVDVVAGHVTPVNLKLLFGPFQFIAFDPLTHTPLSATTIYPGS